MFRTQARSVLASGANGLLGVSEHKFIKPESLLRRLRPGRTVAVGTRLQSYQRLVNALHLLQRLFPAVFGGEGRYHTPFRSLHRPPHSEQEAEMLAMADGLLGVSWWEVLTTVILQVQTEEWFDVNWAVLNDAFAQWVADPVANNGNHLAVYLHYLPIKLYGFTEQAEFDYPPIELLHALLSDCGAGTISARTLEQADLYDNDDLADWDEGDKENMWALLESIESDPGCWPEPVRVLPEIARYSCHLTKNIILDGHFDPYDAQNTWFKWDIHLDSIKVAYRRAKPVLQAFHRLMDWYQADPSRLSHLANFIIYGGNTDALDW